MEYLSSYLVLLFDDIQCGSNRHFQNSNFYECKEIKSIFLNTFLKYVETHLTFPEPHFMQSLLSHKNMDLVPLVTVLEDKKEETIHFLPMGMIKLLLRIPISYWRSSERDSICHFLLGCDYIISKNSICEKRDRGEVRGGLLRYINSRKDKLDAYSKGSILMYIVKSSESEYDCYEDSIKIFGLIVRYYYTYYLDFYRRNMIKGGFEDDLRNVYMHLIESKVWGYLRCLMNICVDVYGNTICMEVLEKCDALLQSTFSNTSSDISKPIIDAYQSLIALKFKLEKGK